ncbi:MAG: ATP-binding protein [Prevotellaceae bacterium]|jgi:predicted AAA+ superfamily ATPase|nr:ATP-binding protein [Prevotellaceae bacterium]
MEKQVIKDLIVERQQDILKVELVERPLSLEATASYVFVGLRRAGKSYLLHQHIKQLVATGQASIHDVLYVNFEDERIASIQAGELNLFLECYGELYDGKPLVFLDEIQNVAGWEKFARRLADAKYRVFVTGSNAKMLSREMHTTLGGRFIAKEVFPFSFREYLAFHGVAPARNWQYGSARTQLVRLFADYFRYGGFAETFTLKDKRSWLNSLYQKVLLGDVVMRNNIRNENAVRVLVRKLAESVMQPLSLARIKNVLDAAGATAARNTLVDYLQLLSDAYLLFGISNFSGKLSEKETFKKRYFFDNGLLNNFLFNPEAKLLENMVAISLYRKYGDEVYYYQKNVEVDFFVPQAQRAVQVAYSIADENTRRREVRALLKLAEAYPPLRLQIVTYDEEATLSENGVDIQAIPVWKWLLVEDGYGLEIS